MHYLTGFKTTNYMNNGETENIIWFHDTLESSRSAFPRRLGLLMFSTSCSTGFIFGSLVPLLPATFGGGTLAMGTSKSLGLIIVTVQVAVAILL